MIRNQNEDEEEEDEEEEEEEEVVRRHTEREIRTRWLKAINTRLTEDKIIATKVKQDEKSLHRVKETWEPALRRSAELPHNWAHNREVLVGRRAQHLALEGCMI